MVDLLKHALAGLTNHLGFVQDRPVLFVLLVILKLLFFLWLPHVFHVHDCGEVCWDVVIEVGDFLLLLANRAGYHVVVSLCYVNQALLAESSMAAAEHLGHFELVRQVELLQADITAKELIHCYSL